MADPTTTKTNDDGGIVDIHTHVYPPAYMDLLRSRTTVPYIRTFPSAPDEQRLIILPGEDDPTSSTVTGRPIGPEYYSISQKLSFMNTHSIQTSVISLANPWLDFLPPSESPSAAVTINDDINSMCSAAPGRLYAFATLPVSAGAEECIKEVKRLKKLKWVRGIVMGTGGMGRGLDDVEIGEVWRAIEEEEWVVFLHPHYGLDSEVYGPRLGEYGHVLQLAMGFPVETTIALSRMLLAGVFDHFPRLSLLLAHSGGTLPFLAGRLESCIAHDGHLKSHRGEWLKSRRSVWEVLKENILLDAVVYSPVGLRAAVEVAGEGRVLFGTDHPFFPPLGDEGDEEVGDKKWLSVTTNVEAAEKIFENVKDEGERRALVRGVLGGNAVRLLGLVPKD